MMKMLLKYIWERKEIIMLQIKNIDFSYGKLQVLWDVSLTINEGEIVGLLGANGAGKTTLLKNVSGLLCPDSGSVEFMGERIDGQPSHSIAERGISLVPEGGRVFPDMTVRENLEMGAYPTGVWKQKEDMIERVYDIFPVLKERKKQRASTLSGGERQMLAMARSIMSQPKLCMFDEMSYGLAPRIVTKVFQTIESLREQGITILLIEQNVKDTLQIADRAYVMENGKIVMDGCCQDLRESDYIRKVYLGL